MKRFFGSILALLISSVAISQVTKPTTAAAKNNAHLKVYNLAMNTGDINAASLALNYYITEAGTETPYSDTLAMLYMQMGSFAQSYYWAELRSKTHPDDNNLLEMRGICLEKMQQPKEAISIFEKLFGKTQSPYHAYKLMGLQYSIKRLAECVATANAAEKLQFKPEYVMTYNIGDQVGRTYLQAGIFNIHGLALYDLDRKAESKAYFQKAIALDSNFALAKQNLEAIRTLENNPGKVNNTPTQQASPANKQN